MISANNTKDLISLLSLQPHPEGGHFKETYRGQTRVTSGKDSASYSASTAIYYMLQGREKSTWHRIASDEMWHFYEGMPIRIYVLEPDGSLKVLRLGNPLRHDGASFQALVPAGQWFAAECEDHEGFGLVGCTVAPGFEFQDFEIADKSFLEQHWPEHVELIARLVQ
ncbi:cupin domain-containing protein [Oxalobacteraceae bacterium OTU3CINTB1]|nr:cupin domain-containing protein [Oxalobacteraceae bacterium OTU3CINTB1]